jgi:hypothetical protein
VKAARLLKEARARGAEVYLKDDGHAAFAGQLPDQLVTAMRAAKTEIVAELKREAAAKPEQVGFCHRDWRATRFRHGA